MGRGADQIKWPIHFEVIFIPKIPAMFSSVSTLFLNGLSLCALFLSYFSFPFFVLFLFLELNSLLHNS